MKRPRKNRAPAPPPPRFFLSTGRAVALGLVALVALVAFSWLRSPAPAPSAPPAPRPAPRPTPSAAAAKLSSDEGVLKARKAGLVWAAFDQLPAEQRTRERLTDALDASAQIIRSEPGTADDRMLLEQQGIQFRQRAAPMAFAEARAQGDKADTLVPSPDRDRCLEWGARWSQDAANMIMLGFRRIECAGSPPKVWVLKQ